MSENQPEEKQPTPEEIKAYREKMHKFYDQEIPMLKKQREFEVLKADAEEARARRITMTIRIANMLNPDKPKPEAKKEDIQP